MAEPTPPEDSPLNDDALTWSALLGGWIEYARSTLALPDDGAAGSAMKETVSDVVMLQAVWFALRDLDRLAPSQRALGLDRAALLVRRHTDAIKQAWAGLEMPEAMVDLLRDAREQLAACELKYRA